MLRMNYLERQQFITDLQKKLSEYIIGDVAIQEVMSLDSGSLLESDIESKDLYTTTWRRTK